jgi:hypothetical protein
MTMQFIQTKRKK